jgi:hypothetical protein
MNTTTKNAISRAYFTKGAYLVDAHGVLSSPNNIKKIVPDNTVIYFLAQPGFCLYIPTTLGIQNEFFTSKNKLFNFLYRAGNAVNKPRNINLTNVSNIDTRIKIPGDKYLNMNVYIEPNKRRPTMGYVKPLPTITSDKIPTFKNVIPLRSGRYRLSELLKDHFPGGGVFIISACRAIPGNRNNDPRMRHPKYGAQQPARGTAWTNALTSWENFKKPIKGRYPRTSQQSLVPFKDKTVKSSKYPPATLKKLRELVTKNGKNVLTALKNIGARANLESRLPGELPFLMNQQRLAKLPNTRSMRLRSGIRKRLRK